MSTVFGAPAPGGFASDPAVVVQLPDGRRQHRDDAARDLRRGDHPRRSRSRTARSGPASASPARTCRRSGRARSRRSCGCAKGESNLLAGLSARTNSERSAAASRASCACRCSGRSSVDQRQAGQPDRHRHAADAAHRADARADGGGSGADLHRHAAEHRSGGPPPLIAPRRRTAAPAPARPAERSRRPRGHRPRWRGRARGSRGDDHARRAIAAGAPPGVPRARFGAAARRAVNGASGAAAGHVAGPGAAGAGSTARAAPRGAADDAGASGAAATQRPPPRSDGADTEPRAPAPGSAGCTAGRRRQAQIIVTPPGTEFRVAGGPYTVPVSINNASRVVDGHADGDLQPRTCCACAPCRTARSCGRGREPRRSRRASTPRPGASTSRSRRSGDQTGASGAGLLAALLFDAVGPGSVDLPGERRRRAPPKGR